MFFSERIKSMQSSPIRRLIPYADEAKAKGKKVYHLNIGQPDVKTPPAFLDAIKNFNQEVVEYSTSQGDNALRDAMSHYYQEWGIDMLRNDILVTNGGSEALMFAIMAICDPGDNVLIPEPYYANYNAFSQSINVSVLPIPTKVENGFHLPPVSEIEKLITPKTRAILITNPGNPTGIIYTEAEVNMIADLILKHDLYLISDEVYREFAYDGLKMTSAGHIKNIADRAIIIDSISKRYSACGARIGSIAIKNKEFLAHVLKLCQGRLCVPTLEQIGATALYSTPKTYFEEVNKEYQERRDTLDKALKSMQGVFCVQPKGAFYSMVRMPVDDAEKFIIWMLGNYDINGETVMGAPGTGFYSTPSKGISEMRLAYVLKNEDLVKAMNILRGALEAYPGRIESVIA